VDKSFDSLNRPPLTRGCSKFNRFRGPSRIPTVKLSYKLSSTSSVIFITDRPDTHRHTEFFTYLIPFGTIA